MKVEAIPFTDYVELVESGEGFAQANLGDGEWGCILGETGSNVNGESYEPELQAALVRTLAEPGPYWYGTNPAKRQEDAVRRLAHGFPGVTWVEKDTISEANVRGELGPLLEALSRRDVLLVGNEAVVFSDELREILSPYACVMIHPSEAWRTAEALVAEVESYLDPGVIVLFAAGMASNLVIHELVERGVVIDDVSLLDVGATLDPYAGLRSRKAYRRDEWWRDAYPRNLAWRTDR